MTDYCSTNRRYLALWFPYLPADRLRSRFAEAPDPAVPLGFTEKVKGALRLVAVDQAARSLGIEPGMSLADARSRVPGLQAFDLDRTADEGWLERIADGCIRYSPMVALDPSDGLILDITGCAHLFGGEKEVADAIERWMAHLKMTVRMAFASSARAAHALARFQTLPARDEKAAVRRLPVGALELEAELTQGLIRAGIKTVGELANRPMAGIAARFGGDAVKSLRHLLGEDAKPIRPRIPVAPILAQRRFPEPVARTEYALEVLRELAAETVCQMEERGQGGRKFEAFFFRSDGEIRILPVETSHPVRDPALIIRLFQERIEGLSDPLDPGFGFDIIRLEVAVTEPLATAQLRLEGGRTKGAEVSALVDRLSIRLGKNRVGRLVPQDSHIPEQMQLALPAVEESAPTTGWARAAPGEPPLRPLHLFDPPQPIQVFAEIPNGPPYRFRWRRGLYEIRRFEGPERIASEWWKRRDGSVDRAGLTRDYYRVEDARGRRFWLFRHGVCEEKPAPRWYVHGLFA